MKLGGQLSTCVLVFRVRSRAALNSVVSGGNGNTKRGGTSEKFPRTRRKVAVDDALHDFDGGVLNVVEVVEMSAS